ncbi:MAG: hypothetical protein JWM11_3593 [Planctomycetaceae bacterium]|nr:hypothetical protein [Planctomycetaceae bacterium]
MAKSRVPEPSPRKRVGPVTRDTILKTAERLKSWAAKLQAIADAMEANGRDELEIDGPGLGLTAIENAKKFTRKLLAASTGDEEDLD